MMLLNGEFEKLIFRLEEIAHRLEKVQLKSIEENSKNISIVQETESETKAVVHYKSVVLDGPLKDFIKLSSQIGPDVEHIVSYLKNILNS